MLYTHTRYQRRRSSSCMARIITPVGVWRFILRQRWPFTSSLPMLMAMRSLLHANAIAEQGLSLMRSATSTEAPKPSFPCRIGNIKLLKRAAASFSLGYGRWTAFQMNNCMLEDLPASFASNCCTLGVSLDAPSGDMMRTKTSAPLGISPNALSSSASLARPPLVGKAVLAFTALRCAMCRTRPQLADPRMPPLMALQIRVAFLRISSLLWSWSPEDRRRMRVWRG